MTQEIVKLKREARIGYLRRTFVNNVKTYIRDLTRHHAFLALETGKDKYAGYVLAHVSVALTTIITCVFTEMSLQPSLLIWAGAHLFVQGLLPTWDFFLGSLLALVDAFGFNLPNIVGQYLLGRIDDIEAKSIGEYSEFAKARKELAQTIERMTRIKKQLADSAQIRKVDYFDSVIQQLEEKLRLISETKQGMDLHETQVKTALEACRERANRVRAPLNDFELMGQARKMLGDADVSIDRAQAAIIESIGQIELGFAEAREQIDKSFEEAGIQLAIEVSQGGSFMEDFARLEAVIAEYVPADKTGTDD